MSGAATLSASTAARRILILTVDPAFPPVSGADLRNYQNAKAAARFGNVCLVSVRPDENSHAPDGNIRTEALTRRGDARSGALRRRRTGIEPRIPIEAAERLDGLVRDFAPDTIVVEGIPLFGLIARLRSRARLLVLDMHNVESLLAGQVSSRRNSVESLLPFRWTEQGRILELERSALAMVDCVWVCSQLDGARVGRLFGAAVPIVVVPNGIPRFEDVPASLPPFPDKGHGWPSLLFVGHLGYPPNVAAAERLARNILPAVRLELPQARALIAGRRPDPQVLSLASLPGVEVVADPADLTQLFRGSHLAVMPLSAGGGTRIKILEANAHGIAVIATATAAEGRAVENGSDIVIADTDAALAQAVVYLCADPERLERQRRIAYDRAVFGFGPPAIQAAVAVGLGVPADAE
ncbi:MAG: glycosyltransferase [Hyphomicrobiales bacterium]|nr:glycosyltransferase [Hyphomicrobiales bacterium]